MTPQQKQILQDANERGGTITKKEIVEMYGGSYYCGADNHLGAMLSRMVNAGLLVRVKPGVFEIGKGTKQKPVAVIENQTTLF